MVTKYTFSPGGRLVNDTLSPNTYSVDVTMDESGGRISKELVLTPSHSHKNILVTIPKKVNTVSGNAVPFVKEVTTLGVNKKVVLLSGPNELEYRPDAVELGLYNVTVSVKSTRIYLNG
jgi:hypothetical protein